MIQGTAGSMSKLAVILFEDELEKIQHLDKCLIIALVHDEINCESLDTSLSEQFRSLLEQCMIKAGTYFCKTIPMKVDTHIGKSWGEK